MLGTIDLPFVAPDTNIWKVKDHTKQTALNQEMTENNNKKEESKNKLEILINYF